MDAGYRIGIVISIDTGSLGDFICRRSGVMPVEHGQAGPQAVIRRRAATFAGPATIA
jgi:hypothetical protein